MPKDWRPHKDLLEKLYIKEDKSLEEVKGILETQKGFSASTRSYRSKFDEWNFRKKKSAKNQRVHYVSPRKLHQPHTSTTRFDNTPNSQLPLPVAAATENSPIDTTKYPELNFPNSGWEWTQNNYVPAGAINADDLSAKVWTNSPYALEAFIAKWQDGGQYLDKVLELLQAEKFRPGCILESTLIAIPGANLFMLLQANISSKAEQVTLITAMLNARFSPIYKEYATYPKGLTWVSTLCSTFNTIQTSNWAVCKKNIRSTSDVRVAGGNLLVECALTILAERHLLKLRSLIEPFIESGETSGLTIQQLCGTHAQYILIMEDIHRMGLTPAPDLYRYYLTVRDSMKGVMKNPLSSF